MTIISLQHIDGVDADTPWRKLNNTEGKLSPLAKGDETVSAGNRNLRITHLKVL